MSGWLWGMQMGHGARKECAEHGGRARPQTPYPPHRGSCVCTTSPMGHRGQGGQIAVRERQIHCKKKLQKIAGNCPKSQERKLAEQKGEKAVLQPNLMKPQGAT